MQLIGRQLVILHAFPPHVQESFFALIPAAKVATYKGKNYSYGPKCEELRIDRTNEIDLAVFGFSSIPKGT